MTGIFFDIDDTLYDRQGLLLRAAHDTLAWAAGCASAKQEATDDSPAKQEANDDNPEKPNAIAAVPEAPSAGWDPDEFVRIYYRKSDENFHLVESGQITAWESNVWRLEETFRVMGLPCPEGTGGRFADRYTYLQNHITLSPVMEDMLKELHFRQIPVGILTNGESDHQWKKVRMLGLRRWIPESYVIVSGDLGVSKPDEAIFRAAEHAMGLDPQDLWMVGDSLKHDILGAGAAGWHTLWLDRRGTGSKAESRSSKIREAASRSSKAREAESRDGFAAGRADIRVETEEALAEAVVSQPGITDIGDPRFVFLTRIPEKQS